MPRKDKTFSDRDIIRIFTRELTFDEQENVRCFFLVQELNKENNKKGEILILKIASLFLRSIPGFSLLMDLFLEAVEVFDLMESRKSCIKRIQALAITPDVA